MIIKKGLIFFVNLINEVLNGSIVVFSAYVVFKKSKETNKNWILTSGYLMCIFLY